MMRTSELDELNESCNALNYLKQDDKIHNPRNNCTLNHNHK